MNTATNTGAGTDRPRPSASAARAGADAGGPGRRARRGDVRAAALALLTERPMHGYEMIQELEERTDGVWRPSPGAVYPALQLLEDQGLVTADAEAGKRLFSLTDTGREEAAKLGDRKPWDDVTAGIDPSQFKLRDALGPDRGRRPSGGTRRHARTAGSRGRDPDRDPTEALRDPRRVARRRGRTSSDPASTRRGRPARSPRAGRRGQATMLPRRGAGACARRRRDRAPGAPGPARRRAARRGTSAVVSAPHVSASRTR